MSSETERPDAAASEDANTPSAQDANRSRPAEPTPSTSGESDASGSRAPEAGDSDVTDDNAQSDSGTDRTADRYSVETEDTRRSPALIATAVALPVALIVVVLAIAVFARQHPTREALALGSVPQPQANGQACTTLLPALPSSVGRYTRVELAQPAPPATVGWQLPDGGDPVVLRCGLDRPAEFVASAALQVINGVNWFEVRDPASGITSGTWYVVDRGTYIAVTMPDKAGPTPLQDISNVVAKVLPARPIDPAPIPN
ncbi:DUF3515 domain-containing protein [Nocardia vaccinii]|uniref:DUF3515 domain-containing protein n=1 Tax=Nocardia vaccinii TaxID=1822 RepID=UPI00082E2D4A|nr:DUF3515 domain-containing protein [Nocardia vaccinii]